ncbi:MAG: ArsC/Spx/MgsR family protein [Bacteroidota bacterium]
MALDAVQVFGTKKCSDSRKAERFFKERGVRFQAVDLGRKGLSPGELRAVAARVGGVEALLDRAGARYADKGLKFAAPTGPRIETLLLADPLLLRTPIVRSSVGATVGFQPDVWEQWIASARGR